MIAALGQVMTVGIAFPPHHFVEVVLPSLTPTAVLVSLVTKSRKSLFCSKTPELQMVTDTETLQCCSCASPMANKGLNYGYITGS